MKYMLLFTENPAEFAKREHPEQSGAYWGGWSAYIAAMTQAGIIVKGDGLMPPSTATTIRIRDGKRHVQDGPFADTKEQLGGYFVIEAPNLDTALEWAAKSPSASNGCVEVRPVLPPMQPPAA